MGEAGSFWLKHYGKKTIKLRWKLFAIFLGIVGGPTLALILEWYFERNLDKRLHNFRS